MVFRVAREGKESRAKNKILGHREKVIYRKCCHNDEETIKLGDAFLPC
jgi:hypothetical protein